MILTQTIFSTGILRPKNLNRRIVVRGLWRRLRGAFARASKIPAHADRERGADKLKLIDARILGPVG